MIFPFQYAVFGYGEDDDCKGTSYRRSYHPSSKYLRNSLPSPVNSISTKGCDADTDHSTDYAVTWDDVRKVSRLANGRRTNSGS